MEPTAFRCRHVRMRVLRVGVVLIVLGMVVIIDVVGSPAAWACTCVGSSDPDSAGLGNADAAFIGTMSSHEQLSQNTARWTFDVTSVFKGNVARSQRVVSTLEQASCGETFQLGATYLVFGSSAQGLVPHQESEYAVSSCGHDRLAALGERPRGFPEGASPVGTSKPGSSWPPVVGLVLVVAIAAAGGLTVRHRRLQLKDPPNRS